MGELIASHQPIEGVTLEQTDIRPLVVSLTMPVLNHCFENGPGGTPRIFPASGQ